jgi:capsule synthesis protein PGA_cap
VHLRRDCYAFEAPPATARTLAWAGFDVMSLANNHSHDYDEIGQRQTLAALRAAGVRHTGLRGEIAYVRRRGIRIAIIGLAPYPWSTPLTDTAAATALVRRANRHADIVVVAIHAGAEGANALHVPFGEEVAFGERRGNTRAIAHALVDTGADLVVGSGPHVIRGVERYKGALIAYSAGDFAGYHTFSLAGPLAISALVTVRIGAHGHILGGRWASLRLAPPGAPAPDPKHTSAKLAAWLSKLDFKHPGVRADGRLISPGSRARPRASRS